jgi:hypothetical protein
MEILIGLKDYVPLFQTLVWACLVLCGVVLLRRLLKLLLQNPEILDKLNLSFKGVNLEVQLRTVQERQKRQQDQIDSLKFLISYFVSDYELAHLEELEKGGSENYQKSLYFREELRRLRPLGLIESLPGKHVGEMTDDDRLTDYVRLTQRGKDYLALRRKLGVLENEER